MEFDYLVTIVTKQEIDGEKEVLEVITHASFEGDCDDYVISYNEQEEDGAQSRTTLHVQHGEKITVSRKGEITTHMEIEKGKRNLSHHVTPYGSFSMGIRALKIETDMSEKGGKLNFAYMTDIEMNNVGVIEFDIELKQKAKSNI